jgi:hypothetical protein
VGVRGACQSLCYRLLFLKLLIPKHQFRTYLPCSVRVVTAPFSIRGVNETGLVSSDERDVPDVQPGRIYRAFGFKSEHEDIEPGKFRA